jgi:hypothetical protein
MVPSPEEEDGSLLNIDLDEALDQYVRERARLVKRLKELLGISSQLLLTHGKELTYTHFTHCP